ncbi:hypothetical protein FA95DRAFT_1575056 [Auriscalpium vulgare]|uniref:Uncharacterized protein n=1 Tax=Auriscalpium vulgare TaxID=40419 RepID=A0ACB8RH87_9AGAM|nr:hypothetical protein FA95DRAFT_1575056 [Auriscalpium vulgare]
MARKQELNILDSPSIEHLRQGAQICAPLFNRQLQVTQANITHTVRTLTSAIPSFRDASSQWLRLLEHERSRVQIMRVVFASTVALGLKSRVGIEAGIALFETCSSMSSDRVTVGGPSIIERAPSQVGFGPSGPCAILGPFRLVNHDCEPNCQTAACTMITIRNIAPDEEITVRYSASGYYEENCACKTCTGKDPRDLSVLRAKAAEKRSEVASEQGGGTVPSEPKKTRRGGAKHARRKKRTVEAVQVTYDDSGAQYYSVRRDILHTDVRPQDFRTARPRITDDIAISDNRDDLRASALVQAVLTCKQFPTDLPTTRSVRHIHMPIRDLSSGASNIDIDLAVLRPEHQNPTHVTPLIEKLARGLFRERLVVVGDRPARPDKAFEARRKSADAALLLDCILAANADNSRRRIAYPDVPKRERKWATQVLLDDEPYSIGDVIIVMQKKKHVTPLIEKLARGLFRERLVVVGDRPARPDKAFEARRKSADAALLLDCILAANADNSRRRIAYPDVPKRERKWATQVLLDDEPYSIGDVIIVMQNPTHVTPLIEKLARGLFRERLVVVGDRPARPDKAFEARRKSADAALLLDCILAANADNSRRRIAYPDVPKRERKWATQVLLDDEPYSIGDVIIVMRGPDDNRPHDKVPEIPTCKEALKPNDTLANYFWFVKIISIKREHSEFHIQWFEHSSRTFLEDMGNPRELFLTLLCDDLAFNVVVGKLRVTRVDGDYVPENLDGYFYRLAYHCNEASFIDIPPPLPVEALLDEDPEAKCPPCNYKEQEGSEDELTEIKDGFAYRSEIYHCDDYILFKGNGSLAKLGRISHVIKDERKRQSQWSISYERSSSPCKKLFRTLLDGVPLI